MLSHEFVKLSVLRHVVQGQAIFYSIADSPLGAKESIQETRRNRRTRPTSESYQHIKVSNICHAKVVAHDVFC